MNRGARQLPIFGDDNDRSDFLETVGAAFSAVGAGGLAYSLMPNHYHLVVRADVADLSAAMKVVGERYTARFNTKYGLDGPLFRGRFHSKPIERESYLRNAIRYVHRNPLSGAASAASIETFRWTSHPEYLGVRSPAPWLDIGVGLRQFGDRRTYEAFVLAGDGEESDVVSPRRRPAVSSADAVEWALGLDSPQERMVLTAGGRGIRSDVRLACMLLCVEMADLSADELATRYGYADGATVRTMASRARRRSRDDPAFAALVESARQRLVGALRRAG